MNKDDSKAGSSVAKKNNGVKTGEFVTELTVTGEMVQQLVRNWAKAQQLDVKEIEAARGGGFRVRFVAKGL